MSGGATSERPLIDIPALIDRRGFGAFQLGVVILCGLVLFLDGFDTQATSYVVPLLKKQWGLTEPDMGNIFAAALVGLMVGYLFVSLASDRFGHKKVLVISTIVFGLFTLATTMASDGTQLLALRFLTGIGLGAAAPSAVALTSEYVPRRLRASCVLAIYCGFSLGFIVAGYCAAQLLPSFGWHSLFYVGALVPLLLVVPLMVWLPESLEFLLLRRQDDARVGAIVGRLAPDEPGPGGAQFAVSTQEPGGSGIAALFAEHRAWGTILLWFVFAINLAQFYLTQSWLPSILAGFGYSLGARAWATSLFTTGGIVAAFAIGPAMDRIGPYRSLAILYFVGGILVALTGAAFTSSVTIVMLVAFASGFCVSGGQKSVIAVAAVYYPTSIRSAGVGWALGIGRIGGIGGPWLVSRLLAAQWSPQAIFYLLGIPMVCAAIAIGVMGRLGRRDAATAGDPMPSPVAPKAHRG
jgi:AAHS family 4-hydroxybenzoate transporter-like MFS transporter